VREIDFVRNKIVGMREDAGGLRELAAQPPELLVAEGARDG
jgi:hypothetical protein